MPDTARSPMQKTDDTSTAKTQAARANAAAKKQADATEGKAADAASQNGTHAPAGDEAATAADGKAATAASGGPVPPAGEHSITAVHAARKSARDGGPIAPKGDSTEDDFSNPHHLGFMRFIMFLIALQTFFVLVGLSGSSKGDIGFSFNSVLMFVDLLFNAVLFWLMWQRRAHTRAIAITFSALNIAAGAAYNIATGSFDPLSQLFLSLYDIIIICYFATSRRVRAVLVRPWTQAERTRAVERDIELFRPRKLAYWRNLAIYFCVFSVVGHWMEAGYCTLIRFGLLPGIYDPTSQIWSDWLYPFMVYGIGFVVCALVFFPFKNWLQQKIRVRGVSLVISFIVNAAVCAGIELVMGLMLNQPLPDGSLPLWDYRSMPFNFMGQICLANAIAFGVAASVVTWFIYPALEGLLMRMPRDTVRVVSVVVFVGFAFLLALYYIKLPTLYSDDTGGEDGGKSGISIEVDTQNDPSISVQIGEQDDTDSADANDSGTTESGMAGEAGTKSGAEVGSSGDTGSEVGGSSGEPSEAGSETGGEAGAASGEASTMTADKK